MDKVQGTVRTIKDKTISNAEYLRQAYQEWRANWRKVEDSPINECFNGTLLSELKCPDCGKTSYTFSKFYELSLGVEDDESRGSYYKDTAE